MNLVDTTSRPDEDEEFLGRLALALEQESDRQAVVRRFVAQRPELSRKIHDLADLDGDLQSLASRDLQPSIPARLGEFRILRLIAAGGMGEVYEAEQDSLNRRKVAIKVIRRGKISPEFKARFLREQSVLARLHQTHVVPVHAAGEQDGVQYFVMQYIRGAALSHVLDAACQETKARASTPTLGQIAERMAPAEPSSPPRVDAADQTLAPPAAALSAPLTGPAPRRTLGDQQLVLSPAYFRSVAEIIVQAAEAIQHAHDNGFVHRDLKPSNIMVDAQGQCWLIDFGLAGTLADSTRGQAQPAPTPTGNSELWTLPGLIGTIPYLAPEQLDGQADARSDVYGLGATLYELCTWRLPFRPDAEAPRRIREDSVRRPRELISNVPEDLSQICLKALSKSQAQRYPSAQELADDLRRWLRGDPTIARPARTPRRVWLWSRRNPGWAAAIATLCLATLITSVSVWQYQSAQLQASKTREQFQAAQVHALKTREQLAEIERIHLAPHDHGWFDAFWQLCRQSAVIAPTVDLRSLAATGLAGPDARLQQRFPIPASAVAFDHAGKRLLIGGAQGQPAHLWDGTLQAPVASQLAGEGAVGFGADGKPLQLVLEGKGRLVLWNVATNRQLREFKFPDADLQVSRVALSADGKLIGACGHSDNNKRGLIAVWNRETGELVVRLEKLASALVFAPDGSLLAAGDRDGHVTVWRLPDGAAVAQDLSADRAAIMALAFGRDARTAAQPGRRWLLAAGDDSGTITIWDVDRRLRAFCRGSSHHIHSLEFSPDGVTLGSVGRGDVKLWDTATGRLVLSISERNWLTDLAFSPDGMSIAVSSWPEFDDLGQVSVWKFELGRGIQTFRGLGQPISTTIFSPDERFVAAIAHDSRVGVWDRQGERLMHEFEAPKIAWVDNAALMFSPDSKRLVCSGSSNLASFARLWDIASGQEVAEWTLAPGLNHSLAFPENDRALLFQVETGPGDHIPDSSRLPPAHPRVGRLYDLRPGQAAQKRRFEITEFSWDISFPLLPEDGRWIVVKGVSGADRPADRRVKVFDTQSGATIWPIDDKHAQSGTWGLMLDRSGKFLTDEATSIVELPSGKFLGDPRAGATDGHRWSPEMPYFIDNRQGHLSLTPHGQTERVLDLDRDSNGSGVRKQFSPNGGLFVWGSLDGTVHVCDVAEVRRRLTEIGLGW